MNGFGPWQYQISLEDPDLKIDAPDSLSASEKNQFPNLAGNIAHKANWGEIRLGGQVALEHQWGHSLSTTIGGGFIDQKLANFQKEQEYGDGYKALVNLLYKPKGKFDGMTLGVEFTGGWRSNADGTDNNTQRAVTAIWFDF